jgi:hypothetical protein
MPSILGYALPTPKSAPVHGRVESGYENVCGILRREENCTCFLHCISRPSANRHVVGFSSSRRNPFRLYSAVSAIPPRYSDGGLRGGGRSLLLLAMPQMREKYSLEPIGLGQRLLSRLRSLRRRSRLVLAAQQHIIGHYRFLYGQKTGDGRGSPAAAFEVHTTAGDGPGNSLSRIA